MNESYPSAQENFNYENLSVLIAFEYRENGIRQFLETPIEQQSNEWLEEIWNSGWLNATKILKSFEANNSLNVSVDHYKSVCQMARKYMESFHGEFAEFMRDSKTSVPFGPEIPFSIDRILTDRPPNPKVIPSNPQRRVKFFHRRLTKISRISNLLGNSFDELCYMDFTRKPFHELDFNWLNNLLLAAINVAIKTMNWNEMKLRKRLLFNIDSEVYLQLNNMLQQSIFSKYMDVYIKFCWKLINTPLNENVPTSLVIPRNQNRNKRRRGKMNCKKTVKKIKKCHRL
ncbi:hypothetical protein GCK72_023797 [Caenorhabditis remanei]|uniref:Uncharacterized protein n=1 Tax=Caenorhabditis remanei TaxID=31234 RepID=A0A6A5FXS8_CAERE|nr:hypothetical protein GCK72_023797 [Caenorhabditis remanei]KAF1747335.1 hypothetical protein GCK72_023797 [Caenorhabditis remanei]